MTDPFVRPLAADARVLVELEGRPLVKDAVMLQLRIEGRWQTVRLFDNAHGDHDMHRYLEPRSSLQSGLPRDRSMRSRHKQSAT